MIACCLSVMVLLCALIWNYLHLLIQQGRLVSKASWTTWALWKEQSGWYVLAITVLCWIIPLVATCLHWFRLARRRVTADVPVVSVSSGEKRGKPLPATVDPPRYQPGQPAPLVHKDDRPWGWLEYSSGNFQGQRLALKRSVVTIGRVEDCDIWLDDDLVSRYHAELAWGQQQICLTDCNSLNGVFVNGFLLRETVQVQPGDEIQIGEQQFVFLLAEYKDNDIDDQYDPLALHSMNLVSDVQLDTSLPLAAADPRADLKETGNDLRGTGNDLASDSRVAPTTTSTQADPRRVLETDSPLAVPAGGQNPSVFASDETDERTALLVRSGLLAGQCYWLDQSVLTIGRSETCHLAWQDDSLAEIHAQIYHQPYGDYIQPLTTESEVSVNNVAVQGAQLLRAGDMLRLGKVLCEYLVPTASDSGMLPSPRYAKSLSGPLPLRLPSRRPDGDV